MGVQKLDYDRVVGMIVAALIREQKRAYGLGVATIHAGTDVEETTGDKVSGTRQPNQQSRGDSVRRLGSKAAH